MSEEEKKNSPNYIQVHKLRSYASTFLLVVSILTTLAMGIRKSDLTFDTQEQKYQVLDLLDKEAPITPIEANNAIRHSRDSDMHMTFDEKKKLIIIEENQKKIGQDLQEIKNLLKRNNY